MFSLPEDVHAFRTTDTFDQDSIPAGLLKEHQLKENTWGKIHIIEGKLILEFLDNGNLQVLSKDKPGIIPPQVFHQVRAVEGVRFYVEFWK
ncbi:MAG: DUF1971 domain-containing protein [Gammaproteobacteria bacterium]|nr:DUF1971 domain-containing protein [Gammaproteobacteria bacterium]